MIYNYSFQFVCSKEIVQIKNCSISIVFLCHLQSYFPLFWILQCILYNYYLLKAKGYMKRHVLISVSFCFLSKIKICMDFNHVKHFTRNTSYCLSKFRWSEILAAPRFRHLQNFSMEVVETTKVKGKSCWRWSNVICVVRVQS